MAVAGPELRPTGSWRGGEALRTARTCYDHLAGRLGVALADALVGAGHVALTHDGGEVTEPRPPCSCESLAPSQRQASGYSAGRAWIEERRPHLAGRLGAALATRCRELGWIERQRN